MSGKPLQCYYCGYYFTKEDLRDDPTMTNCPSCDAGMESTQPGV